MKKTDQQFLMYAGSLAIVYFGVLRPLLTKLGIQQTQQEQQESQTVSIYTQASNAKNPFSPAFYKSAPSGAYLLTVSYASDLAKRIYDALGYFSDDEAAVTSVFRLMQSQSQVSFLCDIFQKKYGTDLIDFLRKGKGIMPQAGLNDTELNEILQIVKKLPKYKK